MSDLTELPEATLARIISFLDVQSLLNFSSTCKRVHQFATGNDVLLWGSRCTELGIETLNPWDCQSYGELYSNLLHGHKKLLGVWTSKVPPYGSVLVVHLHAPVIIGSCMVSKKLNGPVHLRPVFEIRRDNGQTKISCLRTMYRPKPEDGPEPGKHDAKLVLSPDGGSFTLSCCQGCKQDEFELEVRKTKAPPKGCYKMRTQDAVSAGAPLDTPEIAESELEDDAEMVVHMLHTAMLEMYRKNLDPTTPTFNRLYLPTNESHPLEGLWKGTYGPHGIETLLVVVDGDTLVGTKLTGDYNVPAGEITFKAELPSRQVPRPSESQFSLPAGVMSRVDSQQLADSHLSITEIYQAEGQVARPGFHSPSFIAAKLHKFSDDCFGILWHSISTFSLFKRMPLPHLGEYPGGQGGAGTSSTAGNGGPGSSGSLS